MRPVISGLALKCCVRSPRKCSKAWLPTTRSCSSFVTRCDCSRVSVFKSITHHYSGLNWIFSGADTGSFSHWRRVLAPTPATRAASSMFRRHKSAAIASSCLRPSFSPCPAIRCIRAYNAASLMHDLVSADVDNILLIFGADSFQNVRVREKGLSELDAEGLGIHLGIVNGDLDVHVPEITPVVALDHP
jgi:hypothetical protein